MTIFRRRLSGYGGQANFSLPRSETKFLLLWFGGKELINLCKTKH